LRHSEAGGRAESAPAAFFVKEPPVTPGRMPRPRALHCYFTSHSRSSDTAAGYELWRLCNDHLLFHQSHNVGPIFLLPVTQGQKQGGPHEYLDP
jgi:hypothetical protein